MVIDRTGRLGKVDKSGKENAYETDPQMDPLVRQEFE